ncbi:uncharacterized protein [Gossypium hirsutum]|uniref:Uncharacterized protein isoform X2 n=1 Tax=Gossypium hirsutum TaxID=3635 RepID=A0ABM3B8F5_GOSHI|nr:uncharacterized protein LOC107946941 isoform X2 [Gossypium hirsutum]
MLNLSFLHPLSLTAMLAPMLKLASLIFYDPMASTTSFSSESPPITTTGLSSPAATFSAPPLFIIFAKASFWLHTKAALLAQVNTQALSNVIDCSDRNNSKYYVVVVQYTARFNAETVKNFLYTLNNGKISKKKFNLRLAPEETSIKLTGYEHNAVTCIGMQTDIPVILDEAIVKLDPDFFWLGGGEVDLKLGIRTSEFINFVKPFIVSCSGT